MESIEHDSTGVSLTRPAADVAIACRELDESLRFYHGALGLRIAQDVDVPAHIATTARFAPGAFRHVRLQVGATLIKLMQIQPPPDPASDGFLAGVRWITLYVRDLDGALSRLNAYGFPTYSGPLQGMAGRLACVRDPDGVVVEIVQLHEDG